jgi:hypothetical protein
MEGLMQTQMDAISARKDRQEASARLEKKLLEFLVQFDPVGSLTVSEAKTIARHARALAFEEFQ